MSRSSYLCMIIALLFCVLSNAVEAGYYGIKFNCDNYQQFLASKKLRKKNAWSDLYLPYVIASLNLYGNLGGRERKDGEIFKYTEKRGHYRNLPILLKKPKEENGSSFILETEDNCTDTLQPYINAIFSESDTLHLALVVSDKEIKVDGPGRLVIKGLLDLAISAAAGGLINMNEDLSKFLTGSGGAIIDIGYSIDDLYDPNNKIPTSVLKTINLNPLVTNGVIDNGSSLKIEYQLANIDSMEDVSSILINRGNIFDNIKSYMFIDVKSSLDKFYSSNLNPKLFGDTSWESYKDKKQQDQLYQQCQTLRDNISDNYGFLTNGDRTVILLSFLNQSGLVNPHLKKFCVGETWLSFAQSSKTYQLLKAALDVSPNNPFDQQDDTKSGPGTGSSSKSSSDLPLAYWLDKTHTGKRLEWLLKIVKSASDATESTVAKIANEATSYADQTVKFRDSTGILWETVFAQQLPMDDIIHLIQHTSSKNQNKIDILGCYLNFRQSSNEIYSDKDWHWQFLGHWKNEKIRPQDFFLMRVKFNNQTFSKDKGPNINELSFLPMSDFDMSKILNGHRDAKQKLKESTCGDSKYPIGMIYTELFLTE